MEMPTAEQMFQYVYGEKLTKREMFAAMVMQGVLSSPHDMLKVHQETNSTLEFPDALAKVSCMIADALLAELAKTEGDK